MRKVLLLYFFLTFLAQNEGLRDDCPQCGDISANRFNSAPMGSQFRRTPSRTPQYRPIIAAYHPRVSNRQQSFFSADHLLDDITPAQQYPAQRARVATSAIPPTTSTTSTTTTTTSTTTTTTTTTPRPQVEWEPYEAPAQIEAPAPQPSYARVPQAKRVRFTSPAPVVSTSTTTTTTTTTSRPNYRPRPVSVRTPSQRRPHRTGKPAVFTLPPSPTPRTTTLSSNDYDYNASPVVNNVIDYDQRDPPKGRRRHRKRPRRTTTTTTTVAPQDLEEDESDYDDYDDYEDYDYQATTTTTTQRPKGRRGRGRGRGNRRGNRRRFRPTEPSTTTTTTTLSPNYRQRADGRIIDFNADPNFPYELKGADLTDYPFYISIPETKFDCKGRHDGYYANIELKCQVYHHCAAGHQRYDFLCANYTAFDQKNLICTFVNRVECEDSMQHYSVNEKLYKSTTPSYEDEAIPPSSEPAKKKAKPADSKEKLQSAASHVEEAAVERALRDADSQSESHRKAEEKERLT